MSSGYPQCPKGGGSQIFFKIGLKKHLFPISLGPVTFVPLCAQRFVQFWGPKMAQNGPK